MNGTQLWVEIICRTCARHCYGRWVTGNAIPIREFKQEAKERGWRQTTAGDFECPTCSAAAPEVK